MVRGCWDAVTLELDSPADHLLGPGGDFFPSQRKQVPHLPLKHWDTAVAGGFCLSVLMLLPVRRFKAFLVLCPAQHQTSC